MRFPIGLAAACLLLASFQQEEGCTDPEALNYNPEATVDDGSCVFFEDLQPSCDGYTYGVVQIGEQVWFAENLRTTTYADGSDIPEVTGMSEWSGLSSGARCDYYNDASYVATYGRLYNWYAVDDARGLCPAGWHVPTDEEWTELENYITSQGFAGTEGAALKSTTGWEDYYPRGNGSDDFGFSALPGGSRVIDGDLDAIYSDNAGNFGYWWSSSPRGGYARIRSLSRNLSVISSRAISDPRDGLSVRCLWDGE